MRTTAPSIQNSKTLLRTQHIQRDCSGCFPVGDCDRPTAGFREIEARAPFQTRTLPGGTFVILLPDRLKDRASLALCLSLEHATLPGNAPNDFCLLIYMRPLKEQKCPQLAAGQHLTLDLWKRICGFQNLRRLTAHWHFRCRYACRRCCCGCGCWSFRCGRACREQNQAGNEHNSLAGH